MKLITEHLLIRAGLICLIVGLGFQNCNKLEPTKSQMLSSEITGDGGDGDGEIDNPGAAARIAKLKKMLEPNLVSNCFDNTQYNACIFWKNPVAQNNKAFSAPITFDADLSPYQTHAVKLEGYDNSGLLQNPSFRIFAANVVAQRFESVSTSSGLFKFEYPNDNSHKMGQVMAFYWLNLQLQYMKEWTGNFFASNKKIDVISFVPEIENAFWDDEKSEVVIGATLAGNEFALSAEVYAHEMGHANVTYATNKKVVETVGEFKSAACSDGVCCSDDSGCSWAINEGLADYHMGLLFPDSTEMLETIVNNPIGLRECNVTRSISLNRNLTSAQSYNACAAPYKGEVHLMGRVYASIWWEVRKKADAANPDKGAQEVDKLFTSHLPALEGRDDFITVYDKIIATDKALFSGKYSDFFTSEFNRRGIGIN